MLGRADCSKECQRRHWGEHKKLCKSIQAGESDRLPRRRDMRMSEEEVANMGHVYLEQGKYAEGLKWFQQRLEAKRAGSPNMRRIHPPPPY